MPKQPSEYLEQMRRAEAEVFKEALVKANGSLSEAAKLLGLEKSNFYHAFYRRHPDLAEFADSIRSKSGWTSGRQPAHLRPGYDAERVLSGWQQSEYNVSKASKLLQIDPSTLRSLLVRYDAPNAPKLSRRPGESHRKKSIEETQ